MGFTPVNRTRSQQYFGWGSVGSFRFYFQFIILNITTITNTPHNSDTSHS
ncbi:hypothetical protein LINPERPRIM_LOCUS37525 [Linum perenne]